MMARKKQGSDLLAVFVGDFAGRVLGEVRRGPHKKAGHGGLEKNPTRPERQIKLWNRRRAAGSKRKCRWLGYEFVLHGVAGDFDVVLEAKFLQDAGVVG